MKHQLWNEVSSSSELCEETKSVSRLGGNATSAASNAIQEKRDDTSTVAAHLEFPSNAGSAASNAIQEKHDDTWIIAAQQDFPSILQQSRAMPLEELRSKVPIDENGQAMSVGLRIV